MDWQRCFGSLGPVVTLTALTVTVAGFGAVWLYGKLMKDKAANVEGQDQILPKTKAVRDGKVVPSKVKVCYGTTTGMAKVCCPIKMKT